MSVKRINSFSHFVVLFVLLASACTSVKTSDRASSPSPQAKQLSECQQRTQEAKAFLPLIEKLTLVEQLHRLENKLFDGSLDDPTGCFYNLLRGESHRIANKLVYLTTTSTPVQKSEKAVIFDCNELKKLICRGYSADDTPHILEFVDAVGVISLRANDKLKVNVDSSYKTIKLDFYTGDSKAIHSGKKLQKLKIQPDGTLDFNFVIPKKDRVLFAIAKGDGDRLYKKYVWVIRAKGLQ
jgi:hypothetical protein